MTLCKNEFQVQALNTSHILLTRSFPDFHGFEIHPPSSCSPSSFLLPVVPEAREEDGSQLLWPLLREQGSPFPLHALREGRREGGKLLSTLEGFMAG